MVLSMEKQRDMHNVFPKKHENMAMFVREQGTKEENGGRSFGRERGGSTE